MSVIEGEPVALATALGTITVGSIVSWSTSFSVDDVKSFDRLSGRAVALSDVGVLPEALLVAPLTKLGGDLNYIARSMNWSVEGRVEVGQKVTAELEVTGLRERDAFHSIRFDARLLDDAGAVVGRGCSKGLVLKASTESVRDAKSSAR